MMDPVPGFFTESGYILGLNPDPNFHEIDQIWIRYI